MLIRDVDMRKFFGFGAVSLVATSLLASGAQAEPAKFSVYFDWNSGTLSPTGVQLLQQFTSRIHRNSRIVLTGHADTSEQERLAKIRASDVKEKLIGLGVPSTVKFTVLSKGMKEPQLETGPDVREPRNRFVTVVIQ